jgi:hypothetical protein
MNWYQSDSVYAELRALREVLEQKERQVEVMTNRIYELERLLNLQNRIDWMLGEQCIPDSATEGGI